MNEKEISTGAKYKIYLRNITQEYLSNLKYIKNELETKKEYTSDFDKLLCAKTLKEINEILSAFNLMMQEHIFKQKLDEIPFQTHFTQKEKEILFAIYCNLTIEDISKELVISANTVKTHLRHILYKIQSDILLNDALRDYNAEIVDNIDEYPIYKLKSPYNTIKKFVHGIKISSFSR